MYSTAVPEVGVAPCSYDSSETNYSKALIDLSCAVSSSGIYVVVNVIERALNSSNATVYYNTNVVFGRKGEVLARFVLSLSYHCLVRTFLISFTDIVKLT